MCIFIFFNLIIVLHVGYAFRQCFEHILILPEEN